MVLRKLLPEKTPDYTPYSHGLMQSGLRALEDLLNHSSPVRHGTRKNSRE